MAVRISWLREQNHPNSDWDIRQVSWLLVYALSFKPEQKLNSEFIEGDDKSHQNLKHLQQWSEAGDRGKQQELRDC